MEHLVRAGGLLIAVLVLTAAFIIVPRFVSTPEILDDYGLYSGGDNSEEWANLTTKYADSLACQACHENEYSLWVESQHGAVICETCHGPGKEHLEQNINLITDSSREFCGRCHSRLPARPVDFPQVDLEEHGGESTCLTCHNPHNTTFQIATLHQIPHGLEGRDNCLACHGTSGIMPFPGNHEELSKDTCLICHIQEKIGNADADFTS